MALSPYSHPTETISDVNRYFRKDSKTQSLVFTGDKLEVRIPKSFSKHGSLTIGETVTAPGIVDLIFDDKYRAGLNLLASITMEPSDIGQMTYKGIDYLVVYLTKNKRFVTNYQIVQDPKIVYVIWTEFISNGNVPYWLSYADLLSMFQHVKELTGSGIGVSRAVYEGIIAHICRDKDNVSVQYRQTDMTKPHQLVALKSVSSAPTSTIARLNGSYFKDEGLTSALRHQVIEQQPFENLLRGIGNVKEESRSHQTY